MTPATERTRARIRRKIRRHQWVVFASGTVFLTLGLLRYVMAPARGGVNLKTQLPTIVSGAEFMILGALLLLAGFLNIRNKQKFIQMELEEIEEKKKSRRFGFNWGRKNK